MVELIKKVFKDGEKLSKEYPGILTEREIKVLIAFDTMKVKDLAKALDMTESSVYSVFKTIRERRRRWRKGTIYFRALCKDRRFYQVLTPRATLEDGDGERNHV